MDTGCPSGGNYRLAVIDVYWDSMTKSWKYSDRPETVKNNKLIYYPEIIQRILLARGIVDPEEADKFLNPDYDRDLSDPYLMKDMDKAVARIVTAVKQGQKTAIFGDYDADGVPASALLAEFFRQIGYENFFVYIPHRHKEQYGLSLQAVANFSAQGVDLIITVDCGITAVAEVDLATEKNIDVIITDHHLPPPALPAAAAVVDPKRLDCDYPDKMLSGTGVAFKLVSALIQSGQFDFKSGQEKWLLDLVAIATVSDMVPLLAENRVLVHYGLKVLRQTRRPGLIHLFRSIRLKQRHLSEDDIGFMIGPRINSAGRMTHASEAYFLLTTDKEEEAAAIAKSLEMQNKDRKQFVEEIMATVERGLDQSQLPAVVVVGDDDWPIGVLGLAAGRLVEKYQKNFFVWAKNGNGDIKGSCRSDGSVNVVDLMARANADQAIFSDFGGHEKAGGFSLPQAQLPALAEALNQAYDQVDRTAPAPEVIVDGELSLNNVTAKLYHDLDQLGPFGVGNPKPIFLFKSVKIEQVKQFGATGAHLELGFKNDHGQLVKAIAFFACTAPAEKDESCRHIFGPSALVPGRKVNLLAQLEKSFFGWRPELRLRIVDLEPVA